MRGRGEALRQSRSKISVQESEKERRYRPSGLHWTSFNTSKAPETPALVLVMTCDVYVVFGARLLVPVSQLRDVQRSFRDPTSEPLRTMATRSPSTASVPQLVYT